MQRTAIILAYFFICVSCLSQQYPFVRYTPKDGLISNMIKNIYQDSKGRLYFASVNGLSVYDGIRFINYTSKNGLNYDIVNCVREMGEDSLWIITNSGKINCLVNGKMKLLPTKDDNCIINDLLKDEKGNIYAAAEQGLYMFNGRDQFTRLPFLDAEGKDVSLYLATVFSFGDYLIVQRDNSMLSKPDHILYLYNKITKSITDEIPDIYFFQIAPDRRIWVSTEKNIMTVDTADLLKGNFLFHELPRQFDQVKNLGRCFIFFDRENNSWIGNQSNLLKKVSTEGVTTTFASGSGIGMFLINHIFQDREGITWVATNNAGISKLVSSNFSQMEKPFDIVQPSDISFNNENLLLYSSSNSLAVTIHDNKKRILQIKDQKGLDKIIETPYGFFGTKLNTIFTFEEKNNVLYPKTILTDSADNVYSNTLVDKNGSFVVTGKYHLNAIVKGKVINKVRLPFFADFPVMDSKGSIWVATRASDLLMYQTHPEDPVNYLEQKFDFRNELLGISPRSIIIDKNDNIWIGTRSHGIHVFDVKNGKMIKKLNLTTASGLSDDFTTHLTCDADNNIWASSALGLDKITLKNGHPVIENLTKQNNIYQSVFKVVIDKDNVAWGLVSNGLIKITPQKERNPDYLPTLMVSMVKAGKDTITTGSSLTYKQNNLSFTFAATSFLNEKQILYSYRLHGGSNDQWSEPSNNTAVSFIDLPPGDYSLDIKATFPSSRYPDQIINYKFSISPPWWQTWWIRMIAGLLIIGLLIIAFRFYYNRRLEKQMAILEKQQAIEKERTRIATDMHDDLGAGLSRIKFLSETIGIKKQQQQPIDEEVTSIRNYSHEMIDKMGEIVWALNEKNDTLSDLLSYTRAYVAEYLTQNAIKSTIRFPDNIPAIFVSGEFRRNVFLTIKEALHNVVKHSQATEVKLTININHQLSIKLKDNGTGFDKNSIRLFSNGITNMETRIKEIGGKIEMTTKNGTLINLSIPLSM